MEYSTITTSDKLLLARDTLRGREADHFRLSLLSEPQRGARLQDLEAEIENLREVVAELEKKVEEERPIPEEEKSPQQKAAETRKRNAEKKEEDDG